MYVFLAFDLEDKIFQLGLAVNTKSNGPFSRIFSHVFLSNCYRFISNIFKISIIIFLTQL